MKCKTCKGKRCVWIDVASLSAHSKRTKKVACPECKSEGYTKVEELKVGDLVNVGGFYRKIRSVKIREDYVLVYFTDGSKREYNLGTSVDTTGYKRSKVLKAGAVDQRGVIAVDLNGTLATGRGPDPEAWGEPQPGAKEAMEELKKGGYTLIVNSVVGDVDAIDAWLTEHGLREFFDEINESPAQPDGASGKLNAQAYLDDRAVHYTGDWKQTLENLYSSGILEKHMGASIKAKREGTTLKAYQVVVDGKPYGPPSSGISSAYNAMASAQAMLPYTTEVGIVDTSTGDRIKVLKAGDEFEHNGKQYKAAEVGKDVMQRSIKSNQVTKRLSKGSYVEGDDDTSIWVMTTADEDRDGETVDPEGLDFSEFDLNPVFIDNHNTDGGVGDVILGKVVEHWLDDVGEGTRWPQVGGPARKAQMAKIEWNVATEKGREARDMAKTGMLNGGSISFVPLDQPQKNRSGGNHYGKVKLLEFTACPVGSNPSAIRVKSHKGRKAMGTCECSDPGCPVCHGRCTKPATENLRRIDMEDRTGTDMCEGCASDAYESGVFKSKSTGVKGLSVAEQHQLKVARDTLKMPSAMVGVMGGGRGGTGMTKEEAQKIIDELEAKQGKALKADDLADDVAKRAKRIMRAIGVKRKGGPSSSEQINRQPHTGNDDSDENWNGPGWYVVDDEGIVSGPYRSQDESDNANKSVDDEAIDAAMCEAGVPEKMKAAVKGMVKRRLKNLGESVEILQDSDGQWNVSYVSSGLTIGVFGTLREANEFVRQKGIVNQRLKGAKTMKRKMWKRGKSAWLLKSEGPLDDETKDYLEERGLDDVRVEESEPGSEEWVEEEMAEPEHKATVIRDGARWGVVEEGKSEPETWFRTEAEAKDEAERLSEQGKSKAFGPGDEVSVIRGTLSGSPAEIISVSGDRAKVRIFDPDNSGGRPLETEVALSDLGPSQWKSKAVDTVACPKCKHKFDSSDFQELRAANQRGERAVCPYCYQVLEGASLQKAEDTVESKADDVVERADELKAEGAEPEAAVEAAMEEEGVPQEMAKAVKRIALKRMGKGQNNGRRKTLYTAAEIKEAWDDGDLDGRDMLSKIGADTSLYDTAWDYLPSDVQRKLGQTRIEYSLRRSHKRRKAFDDDAVPMGYKALKAIIRAIEDETRTLHKSEQPHVLEAAERALKVLRSALKKYKDIENEEIRDDAEVVKRWRKAVNKSFTCPCGYVSNDEEELLCPKCGMDWSDPANFPEGKSKSKHNKRLSKADTDVVKDAVETLEAMTDATDTPKHHKGTLRSMAEGLKGLMKQAEPVYADEISDEDAARLEMSMKRLEAGHKKINEAWYSATGQRLRQN